MSAKIAARDVKLIPHRWAMHAVQALAQRDHELLARVFSDIPDLPDHAVDTQVQGFGCGAPIQFHDYGFFDAQCSSYGAALFGFRVIHGDTLLLIALRQQDPLCAKAMIHCHASLEIANAAGEQPIDLLFDLYAAFQLHKRQGSDRELKRTPAGRPFEQYLPRADEYRDLFATVDVDIRGHHNAVKARVETELRRIYTQHAPDRVAKVAAQMDDFEYREAELLAGVMRKYGD